MLWRKIKCYESDEFEIIGVERERGKVPVALLNKGGKYAGAAIVSLNRKMRERLWERVAAKQSPAPRAMARKRPAAQWVKPGALHKGRGDAAAMPASRRGGKMTCSVLCDWGVRVIHRENPGRISGRSNPVQIASK